MAIVATEAVAKVVDRIEVIAKIIIIIASMMTTPELKQATSVIAATREVKIPTTRKVKIPTTTGEEGEVATKPKIIMSKRTEVNTSINRGIPNQTSISITNQTSSTKSKVLKHIMKSQYRLKSESESMMTAAPNLLTETIAAPEIETTKIEEGTDKEETVIISTTSLVEKIDNISRKNTTDTLTKTDNISMILHTRSKSITSIQVTEKLILFQLNHSTSHEADKSTIIRKNSVMMMEAVRDSIAIRIKNTRIKTEIETITKLILVIKALSSQNTKRKRAMSKTTETKIIGSTNLDRQAYLPRQKGN